MIIRLENKNDYREVENLTREAFWNVYRPGCTEHFILHNLRNDKCFVPELDYVIEENGKIIAHIAYAKGKLQTQNDEIKDMLLFGPVSVLPEYQKRGYGSRLINYTLDKAKERSFPAVVITGSPEYYGKFGFVTASKHGVFYKGLDRNEDFPYFMIKILDEKADVKGIYEDPQCYFVDDGDVDEFDKTFSPKIKEVRENQL